MDNLITTNIVIEILKNNGTEKNIEGMRRFAIFTEKTFGNNSPFILDLAKHIGKNHELALELWETGYHEARFLACLIADPKKADNELIEKWVHDFNNWAICDSVCGKYFEKTEFALSKIIEWAESDKEYVKRASFALIAWVAVHKKKLRNEDFDIYLELIIKHADDERKYVYKAVNWALRQIGKRNITMAHKSLEICQQILNQYPQSKSARWIVIDTKRELVSKLAEYKIKDNKL
jgi:3-methyladenine DNA glycosylase AlkD